MLRAGRVLAVTEGLNSSTISGKVLDSRKIIDLWVQPYFVSGSDAPEGRVKPGRLEKTDQDNQAEILVATSTQPQGVYLRCAHSLVSQAGMGILRLTAYGKPVSRGPFCQWNDEMQVKPF